MTLFRATFMLFLTSLYLLPQLTSAENILRRTEEFWEAVEPIIYPDYYMTDKTWTTIGVAMLKDFIDNDLEIFEKFVSVETATSLRMPLILFGGRACGMCSPSLKKVQNYVKNNLWVSGVGLAGCAALSTTEPQIGVLCTVPVIALTILLHHSEPDTICEAVTYCNGKYRRDIPNTLTLDSVFNALDSDETEHEITDAAVNAAKSFLQNFDNNAVANFDAAYESLNENTKTKVKRAIEFIATHAFSQPLETTLHQFKVILDSSETSKPINRFRRFENASSFEA